MKDRAASAAGSIVHDLPGRVRLRVPRLDRDAKEATAIADHLAGLDGMVDVQVRPRTGSILCCFDPAELSRDAIVTALRDLAKASSFESAPRGEATARTPRTAKRSSVAHEVTRAFRSFNRDVVAATEGRLDLGTLAVMAFFAAGAFEVAVSRRLPAPPWFNLAWWAFQTFVEFESDGIRSAGQGRARNGSARRRARGGVSGRQDVGRIRARTFLPGHLPSRRR